jgi:hypothetical protein
MSRRYAVIAPTADPAQVMRSIEDAFDEVERSMLFVYSLTDESSASRSHIWRRQGGDPTLVRLVEDHAIPATYISVEAVNDRDCELVWNALATRLPAISLDDLQASAEASMEQDPAALQRLALGAAEMADARTVELVNRGLFNPSEKVRTEAAMAAGITQWPEFAEPLRWALKTEAGAEARKVMEAALASTDRKRGQGSSR